MVFLIEQCLYKILDISYVVVYWIFKTEMEMKSSLHIKKVACISLVILGAYTVTGVLTTLMMSPSSLQSSLSSNTMIQKASALLSADSDPYISSQSSHKICKEEWHPPFPPESAGTLPPWLHRFPGAWVTGCHWEIAPPDQ
jgi:hypothetical protein